MVQHTNAADAARMSKREQVTSACKHRFASFVGDALYWQPPAPCHGYSVAEDESYKVQRCTVCGWRRNLAEDGSTLCEYDRPGSVENVYIEPTNEPGIYIPQHDGIDAFNEASDSDKRAPMWTNLFDTRGGAGGVGQESER